MRAVEIINEINKLSAMDRERVVSHFKYLLMPLYDTRPVFQEVSDKKSKNGLCCVHCNASNVVSFGQFEVKQGLKTIKRQRYRCKNCQKTFTESTATPIYRTKKSNRWLEYVECMLNGLSLRESAKKMTGISFTKLFFWRHKILSALAQIEIDSFEEIVEMDETYFLYSEARRTPPGKQAPGAEINRQSERSKPKKDRAVFLPGFSLKDKKV